MTRSTTWWDGVCLDGACVVAVLCALLLLPSPARAEDPVQPTRVTLMVRVYDSVGLATRDIREANRIATDILGGAGVDVRWRLCPDRSLSGVDQCRLPLAANEAVLRIMPAANRMTAETASLGFTLLDPGGRQAVLSTVFMDRILDVAERARIDPTQLAGRAMAHELGHLLLGTAGHSALGLMRPFWTDDLLRSNAAYDWLLLPDQIALIRSNRGRAPGVDIAGGS